METIKVAKNCIIPAKNILYITTFSSRPVLELVKQKKEKGLALNVSGHKKIASVVFLSDSSVILTNILLDTLLLRLNKGDDKNGSNTI